MYKKNKKILLAGLIWLMIGIMTSIVGCFMTISGSTSIHSIYNVGDVYEIRDSVYKSNIQKDYGYQEASGKVVLDKGLFDYGIGIKGNKNQWNYLCIWVKGKDLENIEWEISFEKRKDGKILEKEQDNYQLYEGLNLIDVPNNSFDFCMIKVTGKNGSSFYIENMQFRETKPLFDWKKAVVLFFQCFAIYVFASSLIVFLWRKLGLKFDLYCWIEVLQDIYMSVARQLQKITSGIPLLKRYRRCIRIIAFFLVYWYSVWVEDKIIYYLNFKYHLLVYSILLLIIAIVSIDIQLKKKNWNNTLVWSWIVLWVMACISDFFISKEFSFAGYVMVLIIGFFIFIWNNMQNPRELLSDFIQSIHLFFISILLFCLLFRPDLGNARYSGICKNPSVFALYLVTVWAVFLSELEHQIKIQHNILKLFLCILEGCIVVVFCWKSQSTGPILCMAFLAFVWFFRMVLCAKQKKKQKKLAVAIISAFLLLIPSYVGINYGLNHIPQAIGHPITFLNEEPVARINWGMTVYASDIMEKLNDSRLGQKFQNATTLTGIVSGRNYYYKTYLRDMNLIGHSERPRLWGSMRLPHNAVIGIAHRYGVFASIPYILMLLAAIVKTFKYSKKDFKYSSAPFFICLSSIIISMSDNIEQPFVWLPWIGLYLMMGVGFVTEDK